VLEVSGNYSIILPVFLANTIAYFISRSLQPVPIFELLTHQDGLYLPSMEEEREGHPLRVEDAQQPVSVPVVPGTQTLPELARLLKEEGSSLAGASVVLVLCTDGRWYAAIREELQKAVTAPSTRVGADGTLQHALGPERTPLIFPDQPLARVLPSFRRWPVLPVSNRARSSALEGMLTLETVLSRYSIQLSKPPSSASTPDAFVATKSQ